MNLILDGDPNAGLPGLAAVGGMPGDGARVV
jgi:hypothetical protein